MDMSEEFQSCDTQDNLGYTIMVLRPYIEERVTIHHLVSLMPCMSRDVYAGIQESKNDSKRAAEIFFNHLKDIEEPGKYQVCLEETN
ncbi:hypothetical protein ElyMa_003323500 [Elysia marginata]|uniref:Uncharacterized protein n=1 Tax=Elysia marginata TaxID=1093978 RepID=A0AAV4JGK0_9GAST|nr:hypothetical protein ElyMa_003323500 [Elysia marginata]